MRAPVTEKNMSQLREGRRARSAGRPSIRRAGLGGAAAVVEGSLALLDGMVEALLPSEGGMGGGLPFVDMAV